MRRPALVALALGALVASGVAALAAQARAAARHRPHGRVGTVVVLGHPSWRSGRPHPVQRWRARLAVAAMAEHRPSTVIFSGGSRRGGSSEASTMLALARASGLVGDVTVVVEEGSESTWENVSFARPHVGDGAVVLVSDPLHAVRALSYWHRQHPADVGRVAVADRGFADGWWIKVPSAVDALIAGAVDRRFGSGTARRPRASRPGRTRPSAGCDRP